MGATLVKNLKRLGYVDEVVRSAEIARKVSEKTGRPMTRQRVLQLTQLIEISDDAILRLAEGLEVSPEELTRED